MTCPQDCQHIKISKISTALLITIIKYTLKKAVFARKVLILPYMSKKIAR